jgi:hypothetical protein
MSASRPEAESEYSRGRRPHRGAGEDPETRWQRRFTTHRNGVLALALGGALLLIIAEFSPLLHVHTGSRLHIATTVSVGSNHSYALVPLAVLATGLAINVWHSGSRFGLLATAVLGLVAIGIALLGDLPNAHSTGLVGTPSTGLATATSSPAIGLYLETAGGALLLLSAAAGLLLEPVPEVRPPARPAPDTAPTRSAS